jgi:hypothetical protein
MGFQQMIPRRVWQSFHISQNPRLNDEPSLTETDMRSHIRLRHGHRARDEHRSWTKADARLVECAAVWSVVSFTA